jgi:hypothetical protein
VTEWANDQAARSRAAAAGYGGRRLIQPLAAPPGEQSTARGRAPPRRPAPAAGGSSAHHCRLERVTAPGRPPTAAATDAADGKKYSGANKYVVHFPKGQTPPANAFWSVTMYDAAYFFVDNPLNRYTVSPRNKLKYNADGSLDLYIQNESPGKDKEANWLPAPKGEFVLMMRLYWPKVEAPSIIDGTWKPPAVKMVAK